MQAISYLEHPVYGVGCKETAIISSLITPAY